MSERLGRKRREKCDVVTQIEMRRRNECNRVKSGSHIEPMSSLLLIGSNALMLRDVNDDGWRMKDKKCIVVCLMESCNIAWERMRR